MVKSKSIATEMKINIPGLTLLLLQQHVEKIEGKISLKKQYALYDYLRNTNYEQLSKVIDIYAEQLGDKIIYVDEPTYYCEGLVKVIETTFEFKEILKKYS